MTTLTGQLPQDTYGDLLTTTNGGQGLSTTLQALQDGLGNSSTIEIATNAVNFDRSGGNEFQLDGVALTATAANINTICASNSAVISFGSTAARPAAPSAGTLYYNTDVPCFQIYSGAVWISVP
jgi:hypothetical protein